MQPQADIVIRSSTGSLAESLGLGSSMLTRRIARSLTLGAIVFLAGCMPASDAESGSDGDLLPAFAAEALSVESFRAHASALAHDSMLGRAPGTDGGDMAATYLARSFSQAGLVPPPTDSFLVEVPILSTTVDHTSLEAVLLVDDQRISIAAEQMLATAWRNEDLMALEGPLEFVGHGVSAPGVGWDDFTGRDLAGKVAVAITGLSDTLIGVLPGGPDAYEGTNSAKLSELRKRGAVGAVFVNAEADAGAFGRTRELYSQLPVLSKAWGDPGSLRFGLELGPAASRATLEALRIDQLQAGQEPEATSSPPSVGITLTAAVRAAVVTSPNVVGVVRGSSDEAILISAHYDGYGVGPPDEEGDSIYNGAADNAAGTAGIVELARYFSARTTPPVRTLVFVATTAEENGGLGMRHFFDHPQSGLEEVVLNLNVDGLGFSPPTNDFAVFPMEGTTAIADLAELASELGMAYRGESWHGGMTYAFDHAESLARGIVGLTVWQGSQTREEYLDAERTGGPTHSPNDEYSPQSIDDGIRQHLDLYKIIVEHYADGALIPRIEDESHLRSVGRVEGHTR